MSKHGLDARSFSIKPDDIVEGHREKTLGLLWKIIFQWKISVLLPVKDLEEEIEYLRRAYQRKTGVQFQEDELTSMYFQSQQLSLLFRWCSLVCSLHGQEILNFSSSFSDGRALCIMLSHYHPRLLRLDQIKSKVSDQPKIPSAEYSGWIPLSPARPKENYSKANLELFNSKLTEIGGIPFLRTFLISSN